jgi:hypothetical protein
MSMTDQVSRDRPDIAVTQTNKHLKTWQQLQLYSFMDMDKLFTMSLLNSFHRESDIKQRATMEVIQFIEKNLSHIGAEDDFDDFHHDSNEMVIYNHLTNYITNVYMKSKAIPNNNNNQRQNNNNHNNNGNFQKNNNNNNQRTSYGSTNPRGAENAAIASVPNTTYNNNTTNNGKSKEAKGPYDHPVYREDDLWFTDTKTGNRYLYLATKLLCAQCSSKSTNAKGNVHKPACFTGYCNKCKLFGHKSFYCRQRGVNISTATANAADEEEEYQSTA